MVGYEIFPVECMKKKGIHDESFAGTIVFLSAQQRNEIIGLGVLNPCYACGFNRNEVCSDATIKYGDVENRWLIPPKVGNPVLT